MTSCVNLTVKPIQMSTTSVKTKPYTKHYTTFVGK